MKHALATFLAGAFFAGDFAATFLAGVFAGAFLAGDFFAGVLPALPPFGAFGAVVPGVFA